MTELFLLFLIESHQKGGKRAPIFFIDVTYVSKNVLNVLLICCITKKIIHLGRGKDIPARVVLLRVT